MLTQLRKALDDFDRAGDAVQAAARADLPGGSAVSWRHGQHWQHGTVIDHGYQGRVLVENSKTGGRRWLHVSTFVPR